MLNKRKAEHLKVCLNKKAEYGGTGFENYGFIHNALPDINKEEIDASIDLFGKKLDYPIIISAMTGGTALGEKINKNLAIAANELGIGLGLGSQRIAIEEGASLSFKSSLKIREFAPDIFLMSNLGAVQLNNGFNIEECKKIIEMAGADALALHLNPLQEAIQAEGNTNFKDLSKKIKGLCKSLPVPVVAKEVGSGISGEVAKRLESAGIKAVDVAGSGGTSWSMVENYRSKTNIGESFFGWGIPTSESISLVRKSTNLQIIAGGGIRSGIDIAKAIALGADAASIALPLLKPAALSSEKTIEALNRYIEELKITMFCVGAASVNDLKNTPIYPKNDIMDKFS